MINDLGGAGKIVESVVSALGSAMGTVYKPTAIVKEGKAAVDVEVYRIKNIALAQAEAALIRGDADASATSGSNVPTIAAPSTTLSLPAPTERERAADRLIHLEIKRQNNLEGVAGEGIDCAQKAEADGFDSRPIDDDWIFAFIDYAQNVSNANIRTLWAKILSSQATSI